MKQLSIKQLFERLDDIPDEHPLDLEAGDLDYSLSLCNEILQRRHPEWKRAKRRGQVSTLAQVSENYFFEGVSFLEWVMELKKARSSDCKGKN